MNNYEHSRKLIITLLVFQIYFSLGLNNDNEYNARILSNEKNIYINNSFAVFYNNASIKSKTAAFEKVLSSQLFNDHFYSTILKIAEQFGFLFFIISENNPNYLLSVKLESIPRSPPLI